MVLNGNDHDFSRDLSSKNPESHYFLWSLTFRGEMHPWKLNISPLEAMMKIGSQNPKKKIWAPRQSFYPSCSVAPPFGFSARSYRSQINKYRISANVFQIVKLKLWTRATCLLACAHTILHSVWQFCNTFKLFMKSRWKSARSPNV